MVDILITDEGSPDYYKNAAYFAGIDAWAQQFCPSYFGYTVQDVSDVSLQWDEIACYQFREEKDANWFVLKWQ